ncbi:MAG TPA: hydroxyacylglutathione hydrolase [Polyangiales bacterium]|nr:hydroxyacylglutathione hydrolase [Polyangiales bacterium]
MEIHIVPCLSDNYAYLVAHAGSAVVVDPSEAPPVQAALARLGLSLTGIWATHHHHDHVGGIEQLVHQNAGLEVIGSAYDGSRGRVPNLTRTVDEGDPLWFASHRVRVMSVPGHTLGAVAYLVEGALFSGDTLFAAGCGRLFEGDPPTMLASLTALRALPPETRLYCGHEYTQKNLNFALTIEPDNADVKQRLAQVNELRKAGEPTVPCTIEDERKTNPMLRWDAPAVIEKAKQLGAPSAQPEHVFAAVRRARDRF